MRFFLFFVLFCALFPRLSYASDDWQLVDKDRTFDGVSFNVYVSQAAFAEYFVTRYKWGDGWDEGVDVQTSGIKTSVLFEYDDYLASSGQRYNKVVNISLHNCEEPEKEMIGYQKFHRSTIKPSTDWAGDFERQYSFAMPYDFDTDLLRFKSITNVIKKYCDQFYGSANNIEKRYWHPREGVITEAKFIEYLRVNMPSNLVANFDNFPVKKEDLDKIYLSDESLEELVYNSVESNILGKPIECPDNGIFTGAISIENNSATFKNLNFLDENRNSLNVSVFSDRAVLVIDDVTGSTWRIFSTNQLNNSMSDIFVGIKKQTETIYQLHQCKLSVNNRIAATPPKNSEKLSSSIDKTRLFLEQYHNEAIDDYEFSDVSQIIGFKIKRSKKENWLLSDYASYFFANEGEVIYSYNDDTQTVPINIYDDKWIWFEVVRTNFDGDPFPTYVKLAIVDVNDDDGFWINYWWAKADENEVIWLGPTKMDVIE